MDDKIPAGLAPQIPAGLAPPPLVRQTTVDLFLEPEIATDGNDPLLTINGQLGWVPAPNGVREYTLEDFETVARNNGWLDDGFEEEDVPTDEELEESDDEEDVNNLYSAS